MARAASTSEAGWPAKQCLKMDKGPAGRRHTLVGLNGAHNWLLGGYGSDTIIGGDRGDVIWGDYHPHGAHAQTAIIHAGNGRNVIYANDTRNFVWTGTNPRTVVHAHVTGISGVIHCQSPGIVVYLSTISQRHLSFLELGRAAPGVVLLDMRLDGVDPETSVLAIRQANPSVILILYSGSETTLEESATRDFGRSAYATLRKPFPPEELVRAVRALVGESTAVER